MKTIKLFKNYRFATLLLAALFLASCSDDDNGGEVPPEEEELEVITNVSLVFTNTADATDVITATATDADGEGVMELTVDNGITLSTNTTYTLTFVILNGLEDPAEDIGEEILEEDDEHQIFFSFTDGSFASPAGDGNIDTAADPINYNDADENGNPVGLNTTWTTGMDAVAGRNFTVRLQHQPDLKSASTGASDGDTDFNLSFTLNIQ